MEVRDQQLAYVPMIIPDMKFDSGELNSMPLIRSIDKSVRDVANSMSDFRREVREELREIHKELKDHNNRLEHQENKISAIEEKLNETQKDIIELKTAVIHMDKRIDDTKTSQDKWLQILGFLVVIVPIAVAVVQAFVNK